MYQLYAAAADRWRFGRAMKPIDQRNHLDGDIFSYRITKDGVVHIFWHNKRAKTLKGRQAQQFIAKIADLDGQPAQLLMARDRPFQA
jgi:hypothetical protein